MSLILDALRKADAERERGAVPGLHAQPVPPSSPDAPDAPRTLPVLWAVLGAALGLAIAVGMYFALRGTPAPAPTPAVAGAPAAPTPPADGSRTPGPLAPGPAAPAAPLNGLPAAEPAPWPSTDPRRAADGKAGADAKALPAEPPVYAREQLPAHIRAQLPELTFGGSIYSGNAANRSLIVNGRLHRESEEVAPGLVLEQIRRNGAVLSFRGYRFEVPL